MLEKDVEKKLIRGIKKLGGRAYKWVSPGNAGVPDRIIIMPEGRIYFVELKTDTGRLSGLQRQQITFIAKHGAEVWVLYGAEDVEGFINYLAARPPYGDPDGWDKVPDMVCYRPSVWMFRRSGHAF